MIDTDKLKSDLVTGAVALGEKALADLTGGAGASGTDGGSVSSGASAGIGASAPVEVAPVVDGVAPVEVEFRLSCKVLSL